MATNDKKTRVRVTPALLDLIDQRKKQLNERYRKPALGRLVTEGFPSLNGTGDLSPIRAYHQKMLTGNVRSVDLQVSKDVFQECVLPFYHDQKYKIETYEQALAWLVIADLKSCNALTLN